MFLPWREIPEGGSGGRLSDAQELIDAEELFTADIYKDYVVDFKKRQTVVKACAFILPTTAIWPVSIVLQRKASTMAAEP